MTENDSRSFTDELSHIWILTK